MQLLEHGADAHVLNAKRSSCGNALHEAVQHNSAALVEALLKAGTSPFAANARGTTAMESCIKLKLPDMLRLLERKATFAGTVSTQVIKSELWAHR